MSKEQPKNPLHGITLEALINSLVEHYGWTELSNRIRIRCFAVDPSVKSTLTFLRKTPWARKKVEELYLVTQANLWRWQQSQPTSTDPTAETEIGAPPAD